MDRLTGLQLFVRVAETGSFSKAAAECALSQPTVTKHISAIEHQLGVRLLNRNSRGISLTEIGTRYLERCKIVLHELEMAESIVGQSRRDVQGTLRIGTSMAFGRQVLAPLLIQFIERHPGLKVDLSCDDRYVDVVGHGLDIAIRLGKLADSSLGCRYVGSNPWVMVAANRYLEGYGLPICSTELAHHECLVYSTVQGDNVWHLQSRDGNHVAVQVGGRIKSNNLSALLTAARAGLGIALLPRYVAANELKRGELQEILTDHKVLDQEINAIFPSARFVPTRVSLLAEYLQQSFQGEWWTRTPA